MKISAYSKKYSVIHDIVGERLEYSRRKGENGAEKTPRTGDLGKEEQEVHR
jgi:hypothetical protein